MKQTRLPFSRFLRAAACGLCLFSAGYAYGTELRAGAYAHGITPPWGIPLAGYYHARGADGVTDDLFAKALVLDDGKTRVALVVCDLISVLQEVVAGARELIQRQSGIPATHVMISATHTHTGPVMARKSAREDMDGGGSEAAVAYTASLPRRIAEAVARANAALAPARASYAKELELQSSHNRRYWMKDGSVGWNPGKMNPNIIRPVGPIDPEVGVIYFEGPDKTPKATWVNFAIHTDNTGGTRLSADMPGALSRILALYKGPEMVTLFANGTCGNINQLNVRWAERQTSTNEANRLGVILGGAVFKAYTALKPVADGTLRAASEMVELPPPTVTPEEVAAAQKVVAQGDKAKFMDQVQAFKVMDVHARQGKPLAAEVQVITMGRDLAWVGLPGEIFVELGLSIKAASPYAQTHIAELANGNVGYVPNRSAYPEGAYEVVSARVAEGSGEKLVTAAVKLLSRLHAEAEAGVGRTE